MVWLEGRAVCVAEGGGELVGGVLEVGGDGQAGEFKSTITTISFTPLKVCKKVKRRHTEPTTPNPQ